MMKKTVAKWMTTLFFFCGVLLMHSSRTEAVTIPADFTPQTKECSSCHKDTTHGIYEQWGDSKHYRAKVGCYECHKANVGDPDAFMHYKQRISIIVSPKDCSSCHQKEFDEFANSHHAQAARILGSQDNHLAEIVEGNKGFKTPAFPEGISAAAVVGCWQCHGTEVKVLKDGKLDPATWPNTGIGRINPDGSFGSCTACHSRHEFSLVVARSPDNCAKCHMGPDHPQREIYEESKHGIAFKANVAKMNLDSPKWILGEDYNAAPTCATCHMSATPKQPITHDVGLRISWNNRPPVSIRPEESDKKMGLPGANINWETRRKNMQEVCSNCHTDDYVKSFYMQYDSLIDLYNNKYAKPGIALMKLATPLMKYSVTFANKLDWVWFELWHHEGRRARMAASMMGPDLAHWHGTYDLAKNFYTEMIPELIELIEHHRDSKDPEKAKQAKLLEEKLDEVLNHDDNKWFLDKISPEEKAKRAKRAAEFEKRYER